jgi:hypothetical protein
VSAVAKAHQFSTQPILGPGLFDSRGATAAIVEYNLVLGLVLLLSPLSPAVWIVAIATHAVYAIVSISAGLRGEPTCHCFGQAIVSPWLVGSYDLVATAILLLIRSCLFKPSKASTGVASVARIAIAASAGIPAGLFLLGVSPLGGNGSIFIEEPNVDLGVVLRSSADGIVHTFKVHNIGSVPIRLTQAEATCSCTVPELPADPILPGAVGEFKVKLNWGSRLV